MNIGPSHRMLINSDLTGPKWRVNWRCEGIVGEPRIAGADNAVRIQQWQWLRQDGADEIISKIEADIDVKKTFLLAVKELQRTPQAQTISEIYPYKILHMNLLPFYLFIVYLWKSGNSSFSILIQLINGTRIGHTRSLTHIVIKEWNFTVSLW